jgi:3',5'-cyclic AMP phosphodiesterase CpdA
VEEQFRILQVSDTHLSRRHGQFLPNWRRFADIVAASPPRLVVNTGDASLAGCRHPDDLHTAARLHAALAAPWRVVPGNHDVGDHPRLCDGSGRRLPVTAATLAAYRDALGADRWSEDIGGWRLIGIDGQLLGSGLPDEEEQWAWLDAVRAQVGDRRLALFLHKPPFLASPRDADLTYWAVDPAPRMRLMGLLDDNRLRLVACGHLHEHFHRTHGRARIVVCPSLAFVASPTLQAEVAGGRRETGYVRHVFHDDHVVSEIVTDDGIARVLLDDVVDEVYPERRRPAATAG